ncbi:MAG: hypothetical protein ACPGD5_01610 [Salibacteraceae bacterium]
MKKYFLIAALAGFTFSFSTANLMANNSSETEISISTEKEKKEKKKKKNKKGECKTSEKKGCSESKGSGACCAGKKAE